jgi:hypothetical protein
MVNGWPEIARMTISGLTPCAEFPAWVVPSVGIANLNQATWQKSHPQTRQ